MKAKRIFSAILCVAMLLCTMSLTAFASGVQAYAETPTERTFVVTADKTDCVIGETVTVTVDLEGTDLVGATWTLEYDATKFELVGGETTGAIYGEKYIGAEERDVFDPVEELAVYEFKAIVQEPDGVASSFTVKNGDAWTMSEAIAGDTVVPAIVTPATVTTVDPDYLVEVALTSDYVSGKKLVLVYTNSDDISFNYDGATMYDVSSKYTKDSYSYSYAIVVDAIENGNLAAYEAEVAIVYNTISADYVISYDESNINYDLNGSEGVNLRDVTIAYGVLNGNDTVYDRMDIVLNADINADGAVNGDDTAAFVNNAN